MKTILIDAMGGDKAPLEILKGAAGAAELFADTAVIQLVGQKETIEALAEKEGISLAGIEIFNASETISMSEPPMAIRQKKDSSLRRGCELLAAGKADAFVSAGSTGALHMGATLYVRRIPGILRAAIGAILPLTVPVLLMDAGANTTVTPEHLLQFAVMGSAYMKGVFGLPSPRVGLLNIGQESSKGTALQTESYELLSSAPSLNFIGNVEGKELPFGRCDVLVTDGFSGNILLKTIEGMGSFLSSEVKKIFLKNTLTKAGVLLYKDGLQNLKRKFDAAEYGGAPLLGVSAPVIKAHGSSDARAIRNAVKQAISFADSGILREIGESRLAYETLLAERGERDTAPNSEGEAPVPAGDGKDHA